MVANLVCTVLELAPRRFVWKKLVSRRAFEAQRFLGFRVVLLLLLLLVVVVVLFVVVLLVVFLVVLFVVLLVLVRFDWKRKGFPMLAMRCVGWLGLLGLHPKCTASRQKTL